MSDPPPFRNVTSKPGPPPGARKRLKALFSPHVDSFNHFIDEGLSQCVSALEPIEVEHPSGGPRLRMWLERVIIARPTRIERSALETKPIFPAECRERAVSYRGAMKATFCRQLGGGDPERIERSLGLMPVMVRSNLCHLYGFSGRQLVNKFEEGSEMGGYFVCNGNERAIRLLIAPRRNHMMAIVRPSFKNRGPDYTACAVTMRCVRPDGSSQTLGLHLLSTGGANMRVTVSKQEYFIPIVLLLRATRACTDVEIYRRVLGGDESDSYVADRLQKILSEHHSAYDPPLHSHEQCLAFLGSRFRGLLRPPDRMDDLQTGSLLLRRFILVHLPGDDHAAKWDMLVLMLQKLYALGSARIGEDNPDSLVNQEVLLPGQIWSMIVKERLATLLNDLRLQFERDLRPRDASALVPNFDDAKWFKSTFEKVANKHDIGKRLEHFLATGNLVSESGLDLQQTAGFTIVAERLNFWRYLSHFRSIHRGAFFAQLRTTTVRKLLPDAWGFLCPVHTPDGSPCGLLNHLTRGCVVIQNSADRAELLTALSPHLASSGAILMPMAASLPINSYLPILLDAMLIGRVHVDIAPAVVNALRSFKVATASEMDAQSAANSPDGTALLQRTIASLELALVLPQVGGAFAALYLASTAARFCRPVRNAALNATELIGPLEQTTLRVAYAPEDHRPGETSHVELDPTAIFSVVASLTPFCDFNQSPRNMYQCQMGKQTMGTPYHSGTHRVDTKSYHIHTPQSPITRNKSYDEHAMDEYATGTNAVVAVIAYTGYDMEDAMIINKMSYERGFGHGSVYLNVTVDLKEMKRKGEPLTHRFGNLVDTGGPPTPPHDDEGDEGDASPRLFEKRLGADGFPAIGQTIRNGDPLCAIIDESTGRHTIKKHKKGEDVTVEEIRLLGGDGPDSSCEKATLKLRVNRNPVPGDKFASRHGQKGVMSRLWPAEDMPFTDSGMQPDILFNPHGFPSRMTIGMLLESMAGKAGASHGITEDSTPFRFSEKHRAVDYFGEQLRAAGYAYHGKETLYSGIYGTEMEVQIFVGVVYYQRLRHMVSDKDQVRAKGPIQPLTRQPIHGRKVHGGIRLGEMERDSLLAHGTSFIVQERLLHCSDEAKTLVCAKCGSLLGPMMKPPDGGGGRGKAHCRACGEGKGDVDVVTIPYVFQYLTNELAAMNISTKLAIKGV